MLRLSFEGRSFFSLLPIAIYASSVAVKFGHAAAL